MDKNMKKILFIFLLLFICSSIPVVYSQGNAPDHQAPGSKDKIDILFITLVSGLLVLTIFITIIIIILIKILKARKKDTIILSDLDMKERRKHLRDISPIKIQVKQWLPDGGFKLIEFSNKNISPGGVFIITENLSLFDLGEEIEIIIKKGESNFFEGRAVVIHSEVIFNKDSIKTESGYGIMFLFN
jgi:hypothetical protein